MVNRQGQEEFLPADTVVCATGMRANREETERLRAAASGVPVYEVGDCVARRKGLRRNPPGRLLQRCRFSDRLSFLIRPVAGRRPSVFGPPGCGLTSCESDCQKPQRVLIVEKGYANLSSPTRISRKDGLHGGGRSLSWDLKETVA